MIYFIRNQTSGAIKIGYTAGNPLDRMRQLQTGHADRLELLGLIEGGMGLERDLHKRFKEFRIVGEWFHGHPYVQVGVAELIDPPKEEDPCPVDIEALNRIAQLLGKIVVGDEQFPVIAPLHECLDHMVFDSSVCDAGIKAFVRFSMDSDRPGWGTPINPKTLEPDPSIEIPKVEIGPMIVVREAAKGIRIRQGIEELVST